MTKFNDFRFAGLDVKEDSNQYLTMKRVSEDKTKIVVRVGDDHLLKTKYGYALILSETQVVFVKDWQVSINYYGNEVILDKNYWVVKEWGNHEEFVGSDEENLNFEKWLNAAKMQEEAGTKVRWKK
ncbi:MAG: hypothetical protein Q4B80_01680 [Aerococcaceae bacterium]|nr:hypothetical protein [Aerococcaceae bacterium]